MLQGLRSDGMAEGDECAGGEWKEKYMALEALLFKFRGQMSVIRELTAEKVSQTHYVSGPWVLSVGLLFTLVLSDL